MGQWAGHGCRDHDVELLMQIILSLFIHTYLRCYIIYVYITAAVTQNYLVLVHTGY
jgi:hypothetical protein